LDDACIQERKEAEEPHNDFVDLFHDVLQLAFISVQMKIHAHIVEGKVHD